MGNFGNHGISNSEQDDGDGEDEDKEKKEVVHPYDKFFEQFGKNIKVRENDDNRLLTAL